VQEVEGEILEAVCRLVKQKLEQYPVLSKIVVYRGNVAQTVEIGEALDCSIYYCNVNNQAGKARQIKELIEGKSQLIAATNVLGIGVDLPDIQVVIYTGQLQKLRDYIQESRKAGRDS
jgi:superfamily II DNA helicase RecQ